MTTTFPRTTAVAVTDRLYTVKRFPRPDDVVVTAGDVLHLVTDARSRRQTASPIVDTVGIGTGYVNAFRPEEVRVLDARSRDLVLRQAATYRADEPLPWKATDGVR